MQDSQAVWLCLMLINKTMLIDESLCIVIFPKAILQLKDSHCWLLKGRTSLCLGDANISVRLPVICVFFFFLLSFFGRYSVWEIPITLFCMWIPSFPNMVYWTDLLTMWLWWSCKNYLIVNGLFYIYFWAFYSVLLVYIRFHAITTMFWLL